MLKNIPDIIPPELMKILMEMGHNDELVLCDGNFPRFAQPERAVYCMSGGTAEMLDAITSLMPLDIGGEEPVIHMAVGEGETYQPQTWPVYDEILQKNEGRTVRKKYLPKAEFYPRAKNAYAVVATGERSFYATVILKKGTVGKG